MKTGLCSYTELSTTLGLRAVLELIEIDRVSRYNTDKIEYLSRQK